MKSMIGSFIRRPKFAVALIAIAAIVCGCGTTFMKKVSEDTGPIGQFARGLNEVHAAQQLGDKDEDQLGKSVAILVTNRYRPVDNKKLVEYVNLVGYTLVSSSPWPDRTYVFGVLDTDDIGAYSGPAGYVMITRGAISAMQDEGELAGVLAHEMTHVLNQHGLRAARVAAQRAGYMDAAKSVLEPVHATQFIDMGVDAVVRNGYDKPDEDDADMGAVQLLIATGYDPRSYAHFLSHIAAMQESAPRQPTQSEVGTAVKQIMSTHPGIAERYQAVRQRIDGSGVSGGATLRERFVAWTR
jgi:predicted Zn-dependent protease